MKKVKQNTKSKIKISFSDKVLNYKYSGIYFLFAIIILTIIIFSNSLNNDFTTYDDTALVIKNKYVTDFSNINLKTYFTADFIRQYDPLTIISHALVYNIWGKNQVAFHLINLLFHLLNIVLVFWLIRLFSNNFLIIIFTTLLFAIHPLRVESVTWIAERKDVLYSFFFICSLISYIYYLKRDKKKFLFYFISIIFFLLSLLSKFAAVVLPAILLIIDYYLSRTKWKNIIIDKIPFILLTTIFGIIQLTSKHTIEGNQLEISTYTFIDKIFLFSYSLVFYISKIFAPVNLYAIRPYPDKINGFLPGEYYYSLIIILVLTSLIIWYLIKYTKCHKEIIFGILFFIINISLVLHIVPFGGQVVVADRYTYLSSIGIFFIFGYIFNNLFTNKYKNLIKIKPYIHSLIVIYIIILSYSTYERNKVWKNSITLFSDVIKKNPDVSFAWYARGNALQEIKSYEEALFDYNKSIQLDSGFADRFYNRGLAKEVLSDTLGAIRDFDKAIILNPKYSLAYFNRGFIKSSINIDNEAISDFDKAILYDPTLIQAYNNRGNIKLKLLDFKGAIIDYTAGLKLNSNSPEILCNRAKAYLFTKNNIDAINDCSKAISINSNFPYSYFFRGIANLQIGKKAEGCNDLNTASQLGLNQANEYIAKYCKN